MNPPGVAAYVFALRDSGSSSPLFGLTVVEVASATSPILIDLARLGVVRLGAGKFDADPYTRFEQNLTTVRMEALASFHVRNVEGAYIIAAGS